MSNNRTITRSASGTRKPSITSTEPASHGAIATAAVITSSFENIGIWVEGVDRLGTAYEGIWRVVRRILLASSGSNVNFSIVAHARFSDELSEFVETLPEDVKSRVELLQYGSQGSKFSKGEAERQAHWANGIDVDGWLIPNPMWASAYILSAPKVVIFHDFLLAEFPQSYPRALYDAFLGNIEKLKQSGSFFVFLSPYVMEAHGKKACNIGEDNSALIVNAPIDASDTLIGLPDDRADCADFIRKELSENLTSWCSPEHADLFAHHIVNFPFETAPYLFVSTHNRAHKGFLRLAQAYEALLRRHFYPSPLFTTALVDLTGQTSLERFLKDRLLMGDFQSVGKVSDETHVLLFKLAELTVHPSTFEGNFPLPFAESVSAGTPCIVPFSRAYGDFVRPDLYEWVFYSPTQNGLISKICDVKVKTSDYLGAQQDLLDDLKSNDLKKVFRSYISAFSRAAHLKTHSTATVKATLAIDRWPPSALCTGPEETYNGSGPPMMHWAAEVAVDDRNARSLFLIGLDKSSADIDLDKLELLAEIGSWDEPGYVVRDRKRFQVSTYEKLPREIQTAFSVLNIEKSMKLWDRIGWAHLNCFSDNMCEIRIGGPVLPNDSDVQFGLARLLGVSAPIRAANQSA